MYVCLSVCMCVCMYVMGKPTPSNWSCNPLERGANRQGNIGISTSIRIKASQISNALCVLLVVAVVEVEVVSSIISIRICL